jgi:hypothetical protein
LVFWLYVFFSLRVGDTESKTNKIKERKTPAKCIVFTTQEQQQQEQIDQDKKKKERK